jgi:hypothetical protein
MNRRIRENNAFGKINKKYALTNDELNEIDQYRMITDPVYANDRIQQLHKEIDQMNRQETADNESVEEPENYFGDSMQFTTGMGGTFNLGNKVMGLMRSAWAKSFLSDFIEESNSSQMKVEIG